MSRLIVKNLPDNATEQQLRSLFSSKGLITDLKVKYKKDGRFRNFAFLGYKTEEEAREAQAYFDQTFVGNKKITLEFCKDLGEATENPIKKSKDKKGKKEKKGTTDVNLEAEEEEDTKPKKMDPFAEFEGDEEFQQFLEVHRNIGNDAKKLWANDVRIDQENQKAPKKDEKTEVKAVQPVKPTKVKVKPEKEYEYTAKLRGLPYKFKKQQIKEFFNGLKLISIRIPPKVKGICYVAFQTQKDLNQALIKHRGFLNGRRIDVVKYSKNQAADGQNIEKDSGKKEYPKLAEEDVCDSGRIFVRNLSYTCVEEDIEKLFSPYGPLSETHLPIDGFTKKPKGFAFVTFVFPEHAVKAFSELDGTMFQGRCIHLIPAKSKPDEVKKPFEDEGSSFKKEKEAKKKSEAGKTHNWNSLFLGANAVADAMTEKYGVEKSKLLVDTNSKESVAVRLALGETQLVNETKKFLLKNGIDLDAFNESDAPRSKNVLLVKNLPSKTDSQELHELFSRHGIVKRVILPEFGITAIIEMQEEAEAKMAFRNLAYSNFHHVPLYLEWAPSNVFRERSAEASNAEDNEENSSENKGVGQRKQDIKERHQTVKEDEEEEEPESESTIFIKNLNFQTNEDSLRAHFERCGKIHSVTVARKKSPKGNLLSLGYGFVQFKQRKSALKAMKELQNSTLDDHDLELKLSHKTSSATNQAQSNSRKSAVSSGKGKPGTKMIIKNVPFEATDKDLQELFSSFADVKSVRLPKKLSGTGSHRGFGFVDFLTVNGAKKAFESLCQSTHLYGRRLVLEWAQNEQDSQNSIDESDSRKSAAQKRNSRRFLEATAEKRLKKSDLTDKLESLDKAGDVSE